MIIGISGKKGHGKDTVANIIRIISGGVGRVPTTDNKAIADAVWQIERGEIDPNLIFPGWEVHRFADKLKDMVCVLLGCTREQLEDREFKEKPIEGWSVWDCYVYYLGEHGETNQVYVDNFPSKEAAVSFAESYNTSLLKYISEEIKLTPRLILQLLGTDGMRDVLHPDIHVLATLKAYDEACTTHAGWGDNMGYQEADEEPFWLIPDVRFPNEAEAVKERGGKVIRIERIGMDTSDNHPSETALDSYERFDYTIHNTGDLVELVGLVRNIYTSISGF